VQTATPDRPHIHQAFEGWDAAGCWVKINPGRAAVVALDPSLSSRTDLPDNQPNVPPSDWEADGYAYPDNLEAVCQAAAVQEMADLARGGNPDQSAPTVTVVSPNGGERARRGQTLEISWEASDDVGITSQDILLSNDGGQSFATVIAEGLPGSARDHSWAIPADFKKGKQYRVRVVARDASGKSGGDESDGNFRIRK
jgi:hypothetical protein